MPTPTSNRNAEQRLFDHEVVAVAETPDRDPRLAAYWDVGDCGPGSDDQHAEWCGGLTYEPLCELVVQVDDSLCISGHASLLYSSGNKGGGSAWINIRGCDYEYFAEYTCMPVTSTSTVTTTSSTTTQTSTSTRTVTTTQTSTRTTTSTVRTTTAQQEEGMMQKMFDLELPLAMPGGGWQPDAGFPSGSCSSNWRLPNTPMLATDHNGVRLDDVCIRSMGPHYVFVIADWGGVVSERGIKPANQRAEDDFVHGVDDCAQLRVASQMRERAKTRSPDYILNAGDNFYWAGLNINCGTPANQIVPTGQFEWGFEKVYIGEGLEGKPWLSVLGNHDYGGYMFNKGWDQQISYTWTPNTRWILPAQYWRQTVHYPGFSVDYYFVDSNAFSAQAPDADESHNICSKEHVPSDASCGKQGPSSVFTCPMWFQALWATEQAWLEEHLAESKADWQIVVTHYPPTWGADFWRRLSKRFGIDLFVCGHMHVQALHHLELSNPVRPTAFIVSGGGGGITSEHPPDPEGYDDQYGFFELSLSKEIIEIQGISHGGFLRTLTFLEPRHPELPQEEDKKEKTKDEEEESAEDDEEDEEASKEDAHP